MKKRSATNESGGKNSASKNASRKSSFSDKPSLPSKASPLPNEWSEFIALLCAHRVRFLVVGGHALGVIGRVRATKDLDILVEPTTTNARRVCAVLAEFGFKKLAQRTEEFATPERMATLGRELLRIDLMTTSTGVTFAQAWRGRIGAMNRAPTTDKCNS
ncbi:MAG: hypothetical protein FWD73_06865 [Polyangiaceae bacterium]|nr:hypothetical protein [Polyangiaceae bacterium]